MTEGEAECNLAFLYLLPLWFQFYCRLSISKCLIKLNQLQKCSSSVAGSDLNKKDIRSFQKVYFNKSNTSQLFNLMPAFYYLKVGLALRPFSFSFEISDQLI